MVRANMFAQFYPSNKRNTRVTSKGQTYTATETLKPVALIDEIIQNDKGGLQTTLKSKLILMIQLTSNITCTTTVILIKFYKISM
jgi:hypothetical protein